MLKGQVKFNTLIKLNYLNHLLINISFKKIGLEKQC